MGAGSERMAVVKCVDVDWPALRMAAMVAVGRAYAPYSDFPVGAAGLVETDHPGTGRVIFGCNVENASYGLALCAECGLVSALHATGGGRLLAVSIVDKSGQALMPCGRCRQLLYEHGGPDCLVDAVSGPVSLGELLPYPFDTADLDRAKSVSSVAEVPGRLLEFVGRGSVFVHRDLLGGQTVWTGYWERASHADEGSGILEEAPNWPDAAAVVAWGRARTPRVIVVESDGMMSWAGTGDPPAEIGTRWRDA